MARKELKDKVGIAKQLKALVSGGEVKYQVVQELIDKGYVAEKERIVTPRVAFQGRGRRKIVYGPTSRGTALLNLSKNWKSMATNA